MTVTGTTTIIGIVGSPIMQVKSPSLVNAFLTERGIDTVLIPMDVAADGIPALIETVRAWQNCAGMIVTVPYKQVVVKHMDHLTDRARRLSTVNLFRRDADGTLTGDITDGVGFVTALQAKGVTLAGANAAVIGAGGVASAIANALCECGVASLRLQDVDAARHDALAALLRADFPNVRISTGIDTIDGLDLLVNGTPVGMNGDPSLPLPAALLNGLSPRCIAADVVTAPALTPFLALAQAKGCRIQTGPEMTAPQVELFASFLGITD